MDRGAGEATLSTKGMFERFAEAQAPKEESPGGDSWYRQGGPEPADFCIANDLPGWKTAAIEYIFRAGHKNRQGGNNEIEDIEKAMFWLERRLKHLRGGYGSGFVYASRITSVRYNRPPWDESRPWMKEDLESVRLVADPEKKRCEIERAPVDQLEHLLKEPGMAMLYNEQTKGACCGYEVHQGEVLALHAADRFPGTTFYSIFDPATKTTRFVYAAYQGKHCNCESAIQSLIGENLPERQKPPEVEVCTHCYGGRFGYFRPGEERPSEEPVFAEADLKFTAAPVEAMQVVPTDTPEHCIGSPLAVENNATGSQVFRCVNCRQVWYEGQKSPVCANPSQPQQ